MDPSHFGAGVSFRSANVGSEASKNKCGPGQPPEPHCYRERSECHLSPERKIIAQLHSEERYAAMLT